MLIGTASYNLPDYTYYIQYQTLKTMLRLIEIRFV